jgi:uncharacterized cysteine cluster protein YcgN (CxxCxxCC family)
MKFKNIKMKIIFSYIVLLSLSLTKVQAQKVSISKTIEVFPYQHHSEINKAIATMKKWQKNEWKQLVELLNDDSLKLKSSYALNAFVHEATLNNKLKKQSANLIASIYSAAKTFYAKEFLIKQLALLGDDASIPLLKNLLKDETFGGNAARALASNHTVAATKALKQALVSAKGDNKKHIQAALDNIYFVLPKIKITALEKINAVTHAQHILLLQDKMEKASGPFQKRNILNEAGQISGFSSFVFVSKYLNDEEINKDAARIVCKLALSDKNITGTEVRAALEKSITLIHGEDSAALVAATIAHLKKLPYDYGFVNLFNGKDLTNWKALVANPIVRAKMSDTALLAAEKLANEKTKGDWIAKDGLLVFTGHGDNLATEKKYGDFEMYVDWKITEKGDAGIYLRGTPQVQIWDTSRREVGAQVGSGGLYNNQKHVSKPLVVADNKVGEWNTFHIIMKGEKVTVYLNGILVTDNIVLENYWDQNLPIFTKEQIELQAHGTYVAYRNIYVKELPDETPTVLSAEEKKEGFVSLFDGTNIDQWVGNTTGYLIKDGSLMVSPEDGSVGNLYTKEEYDNFIYRFEFQMTPGANNGIGVHAPLEGDAAYVGIEVQILDSEIPMYDYIQPYQAHGSVYGVIPAKRGYLKSTGEWNQEEISVMGTKIKVTLNGTVIVDDDYAAASANGTIDHKEHPGLKRTTGHLGFLGHGEVVRFKNMRVKKI